MGQPASGAANRWAVLALMLGAAAVPAAIMLNGVLLRWLVWGLHRRALYGTIEPWAPFVLPALALIAGAVALSRGGAVARAGIGIALALGAVVLGVGSLRASAFARETSCLSNVKQLSVAMANYAMDYDDRLPAADDWQFATLPYAKNLGILCCPSDFISDPKGTGGAETSYTMNAGLSHVKVATVADPYRTLLLFEGGPTAGGPDDAIYRHRGGLNASCADYHAQWHSRAEFLSLEVRP